MRPIEKKKYQRSSQLVISRDSFPLPSRSSNISPFRTEISSKSLTRSIYLSAPPFVPPGRKAIKQARTSSSPFLPTPSITPTFASVRAILPILAAIGALSEEGGGQYGVTDVSQKRGKVNHDKTGRVSRITAKVQGECVDPWPGAGGKERPIN